MWWLAIVAVVASIPALYLVYTLFVVLRLVLTARRLGRECAAREMALDWKLYLLFPSDFEDPVTLDLVIRRDQRRFSFTFFHSLPKWAHTTVRVTPLALCEKLSGDVYVHARNNLSEGVAARYLDQGTLELLTFEVDELDAGYRLCAEKAKPSTAEGLAVFRAAFANPEVRKALDAYKGGLAFDHQRLAVTPAAHGTPFLDGLEQVATLAAALDRAVITPTIGPYR